jgi:hypothetical protein
MLRSPLFPGEEDFYMGTVMRLEDEKAKYHAGGWR